MNPANTEVGKLLSGQHADFNFTQMNSILQNELAIARSKLRAGLAREQYDIARQKIDSLLAALLVLKSVQICQAD